MDAHLVLRSSTPHTPPALEGNVLINRLVGAQMHFVPLGPYVSTLRPAMEELAQSLQQEGRRPYLIPVGGSNVLGLWGYMDAWARWIQDGVLVRLCVCASRFRRMSHESVQSAFSDVVLACGSGGTAAGIAIANYLCGGTCKVQRR
jgi:D-cysteine desulfhydrase